MRDESSWFYKFLLRNLGAPTHDGVSPFGGTVVQLLLIIVRGHVLFGVHGSTEKNVVQHAV